MATNVTQTTFLTTYNDDYRDSDHFHRILFNSGRALQARELTQSQTIIQKELARLAGFVFKEGGIFNTSYGSLQAGANAVDFVKVTELPTGYASLKGQVVSNSLGITATIKDVFPATGSDAPTLYVRYIDGNNRVATNTTQTTKFSPRDILTYSTGTLTVQTTNTSANPATGKGSYIEVPRFNTFVAGHLIMVEKQSLVIDKYNPKPTARVGFKLTEQVVTATDDVSLYDNAGSTPNLTSPGADRYKIDMTLIKESDIEAGETFYPVYEIIDGRTRTTKNRDNLLNELGGIISNRAHNISGNFIARNSQYGVFDLEVAQDSADTHLLYKVAGGVAFVGGNRNELATTTTIRINKPRANPGDLTEVTSEFTPARYGNYFLSDEAYGLIHYLDDYEEVYIYDAADRGGNKIGECRIRNVDEYGSQFRIHVFDIQMDDNSGTPYSIGSARSIGRSSNGYANIISNGTRYDVYDKEYNSMLFPLPSSRVQEISNVSMNLGNVYQATSNGSGTATFSTGSSNIFTSEEDWIIAPNTDNGAWISTPTTSGTINSSVTITGLANSTTYNLFAYETTAAVRKTKTLNEGTTETKSLSSGVAYLGVADIYKFNSVTDNVTNEDITYKFVFDNGQRDNWYEVGSVRLKAGVAAPSGTITIDYDYFSHTSGDFFGGKASYPDIEYKDVPVHITKAGKKYRLTDVIDMRPVKDTSATFANAGAVTQAFPKNGAAVTIGTAKYWNPRVDTITMSPEGDIEVYKGQSSGTEPVNVPISNLNLHVVGLNPYTLNNRDLEVQKVANLGYRMSDIERLESRIEDLEEMTTLNAAEIQTLKTTIADPDDATLPDRMKLGLTADGFNGNLQSAVLDDDYRASINTQNNFVTAINFKRQVPLKYDSDASDGCVLKGNVIWPKYTEEVMITQEVASTGINVNSFEITRSVGAGYLDPNIDTWTIRKKVDASYQAQSSGSFVAAGTTAVSSQGDQTS